uniref:Uncharacterized protein n=1 Tax=Micrurus paraensis TaxID=1970185 RepID=A0A2D4L840_9SAUR
MEGVLPKTHLMRKTRTLRIPGLPRLSCGLFDGRDQHIKRGMVCPCPPYCKKFDASRKHKVTGPLKGLVIQSLLETAGCVAYKDRRQKFSTSSKTCVRLPAIGPFQLRLGHTCQAMAYFNPP